MQRRVAIVVGAGLFLFVILTVAAYAMTSIPDANKSAKAQSSVIYYAGGKDEIVRFGDVNRISVPLEQVPRHARDAVLAAENRSFYTDSGVSPRGIARALWVNLRGGSVQGGSTITQQYVKNYYLEQDRTLNRKLKEAILAIKIDNELSKDQILENYLNTIYFGRGAHGIQAASKAYFNKDVKDLSVSEGALLAAIIRSPAHYDPIEHRAEAEGRTRYVLDGMAEMGAITAEEAAAQTFPATVITQKKTNRYGGQKGYILKVVEDELGRRGIDEARITAGGLRIETTIDKKAQRAAVEAVNEAPDAKDLRVGLAAVEPGTGKIVAMYGGRDYVANAPHAQENNAAAEIQPGSTFKPFTLAAALEQEISLRDRFDGNSPLDVRGSRPVENQGERSYGSVTLLRATELSINTAFVDLADTMKDGPREIADAAERAGIPADQMKDNINVRLTLGIGTASPLQMAGAYATFAAEGERAEPHIVEQVLGPNGGVVPLESVDPKRVFSKDVTADVTYALQGVVKAPNGTGRRARALDRPVAAKTGTHEAPGKGILSAWFGGYTPQLSTAVVFFRGDGTESLNGTGGFDVFTGGRYPARVWTAFMKAALDGKPVEEFAEPANIGGKVPAYNPPPPLPKEQPRKVRTFEPRPTLSATPEPTITVVTPTPTRPTRRPGIGCPPLCPGPPSSTPRPRPTTPSPGPGGGGGGGGGVPGPGAG